MLLYIQGHIPQCPADVCGITQVKFALQSLPQLVFEIQQQQDSSSGWIQSLVPRCSAGGAGMELPCVAASPLLRCRREGERAMVQAGGAQSYTEGFQ